MVHPALGVRSRWVVAILSILGLMLVGGCAPLGGSEPAPVTSPPPTNSPVPVGDSQAVEVVEVVEAPTLAETATALPSPTSPPPSATPLPAATGTPLPTSVPPTPTTPPTPMDTATAMPSPTRARPTATPAPEFTGRLVVQTTIGGDFFVVHADGSGLRRITDGGDPIWSPDGRQIAFVRWREPRGVWVINADGSGEWRVFDWSESRWPSWSPDGSRILFSRQQGGRTEDVERCFRGFCFTFPVHLHWKLGVIRPGDGDFREPPASQFSLAPMWSPDGKSIIYADEQGLRVQSEDGTVSYLITNDAKDTSPVWSPDGTKVAFTRRQHDHWEVYVVDADGRNLRRLTDTPRQPDGSLGNSAAPAWAPDGKSIAFVTDRGGRWEIWVMGAGGGGQKPLFPGGLPNLRLEYAGVAERVLSWTR